MNQQCFQVGDFFLDPTNRLLKIGDVPVPLSPKAFDALVYLAQNPGRLLTREELLQALWPDSYVEEGNLSVHIFQVRKALGMAGDGKAYIQTVPKKGYRFNADVKIVGQPESSAMPAALTDPEVPLPISLPGPAERDTTEVAAAPAREISEGRSSAIGRRTWKLVAGGAVSLVAVLLIAEHFFFARHESGRLGSPLRLTSFSPELSVSAAAISPNGKTLAYANSAGVFLEDLASKNIRPLPSSAAGLEISNLSWFPDGSRLLATGAELQASTASVWILKVKGSGGPERVGAFQRGVTAPDNSQIALIQYSGGERNLFILSTQGGQQRRVASIPAEQVLGSVFWAADTQRLYFVVLQWNPQLRANHGVVRSIDLSTGKASEIFSGSNLSGEAILLPDRRLVYGQLLGANPAGSYGGELRQIHLESRTSAAVGDSVALGRWTEQIVGLSSSADGRRLAFSAVVKQHNVYEGDLQGNGESLSRVHRLTFGRGRDDFPRAWTPDSAAVFFDSNRNGKWEIFKQALGQISDEPYLQGHDDQFSPTMSPDGKSLLYLDRPRDWRESDPVRLMRVSRVDRSPQVVLQTNDFSEWGLRFECPQIPGRPCVLAQRAGSEIVFRRFDPERGFGVTPSELLRIPLDPALKISWALAPDASHLAWIVSDAPDATVHVDSLSPAGSDRTTSESRDSQVILTDASHLHALSWSANGNGWYVTTRSPAGWRILYATRTRTRVLWQGWGEYSPEAWPSPDGRHLAFSALERESNVWMLENF